MSLGNRLLQLALVVLSLAIGLQAEAKCSNAILRGHYSLHATGTVIGVGDFAAVGRFTFDGNGNLTGKLFSGSPETTSSLPNSQERIR